MPSVMGTSIGLYMCTATTDEWKLPRRRPSKSRVAYITGPHRTVVQGVLELEVAVGESRQLG